MRHEFRVAARSLSAVTAATVAVQAIQLFYGLISARLLGPEAFGTYAAVLVLTGVPPLVLAGPLASTVTFTPILSRNQLRSLGTFSLLAGLALWVIFLAISPVWLRLWNVEWNLLLVLGMSVLVLFSGLQSLLFGVARRYSKVAGQAGVMAVASALGIAVGLTTLLATKSPAALSVQPAVSLVLTLLLHPLWLHSRIRFGRPDRLPSTGKAISVGDSAVQAVDYAIGNFGGWCIGAVFGGSWLGIWNRAATFASTPLVILRGAGMEVLMSQRLSRHRRRGFGGPKFARAGLAMAVTVGLGLGLVLTYLVPIALGPEWEGTQEFMLPLSLGASLSLACTPTMIAMRGHGMQRQLLGFLAIAAAPLALFAALSVASEQPYLIAWGYVAQQLSLWLLISRKTFESGRE